MNSYPHKTIYWNIKNKMAMRPSYLHSRNSSPGKTTPLYCDDPLVPKKLFVANFHRTYTTFITQASLLSVIPLKVYYLAFLGHIPCGRDGSGSLRRLHNSAITEGWLLVREVVPSNVDSHTCIIHMHWSALQHRPIIVRNHFVYASSLWEMTLQCNVISHWLDA